MFTRAASFTALGVAALGIAVIARQAAPLPSTPLQYGFFTLTLAADGTLSIVGKDWPAMKGTWKTENDELVVSTTSGAPQGCDGPGRYKYKVEGARLKLTMVSDGCVPRSMVLRESTWRPEGDADPVATRTISRSGPERPPTLPAAKPAAGSWPSFRGPNASGVADGQDLPEQWDVKTSENILWRTPIPASRTRVPSCGVTASS